MKSVLVIDTPESCSRCSLSEIFGDYDGNIVNVRCSICKDRDEVYDWENGKLSFCPLRPLPEKKLLYKPAKGIGKAEAMIALSDNLTAIGWNDCLDEITGETK